MGIVRLRLARFGSRNRPFWRVVAIDSRKARDDKPIEYLGTYDPIAQHLDGIKEVRLRLDRIKYWLSVGGQPSDRVAYLFWRAGILPSPPIRWQTQYNRNKKELREAAKKGFHTLAAPAGVVAPSGGVVASSGSGGAFALSAPHTARILRTEAMRQPLGLFSTLLARHNAGPLQALR